MDLVLLLQNLYRRIISRIYTKVYFYFITFYSYSVVTFIVIMAIPAGTQSTLNGSRPKLNSSEEAKFLWLLIQEVRNNTAALYNVFTSTPVAFTVGTTTGAPVNTATTWVISTINTTNKRPVFLLNGVPMTLGVDYTFNNATGTMTLLAGGSPVTYQTGQVITVLY